MLSQEVSVLERENDRLNRENEELRRLLGTEPVKPKNCHSCKFFIQHYIHSGINCYAPVDQGHCICGKQTKSRKASEKNCQYYEEGRNYYS